MQETELHLLFGVESRAASITCTGSSSDKSIKHDKELKNDPDLHQNFYPEPHKNDAAPQH
jgi:hypothetical protein